MDIIKLIKNLFKGGKKCDKMQLKGNGVFLCTKYNEEDYVGRKLLCQYCRGIK